MMRSACLPGANAMPPVMLFLKNAIWAVDVAALTPGKARSRAKSWPTMPGTSSGAMRWLPRIFSTTSSDSARPVGVSSRATRVWIRCSAFVTMAQVSATSSTIRPAAMRWRRSVDRMGARSDSWARRPANKPRPARGGLAGRVMEEDITAPSVERRGSRGRRARPAAGRHTGWPAGPGPASARAWARRVRRAGRIHWGCGAPARGRRRPGPGPAARRPGPAGPPRR
mmetsp:Transcript_41222/g.96425  ORF Transcript_41222/g.96425 Transcript_41222/m.96425 type:complete len:226 (+) Transcript_41222:1566-2243(+)